LEALLQFVVAVELVRVVVVVVVVGIQWPGNRRRGGRRLHYEEKPHTLPPVDSRLLIDGAANGFLDVQQRVVE